MIKEGFYMKKLLLILFSTLLFSSKIHAQQSDDIWIKKVVALYIVYLQRAPDHKGLTYWINKAQTEQNRADILKKISAKFATYPLFLSTYGTLNNQLFVQKMYQYILGKEGNSSGINYWKNLLDEGLKRSDMIVMFINSSLTPAVSKENSPELTEEEIKNANLRKKIISNKIELALYFTYSLKELSNIKNLSSVKDDPAYIASRKVLLSLYSNPLDKSIGVRLIDNAMSSDNPIEFIINNSSISISGTITYVRPLLNSNHIGLSSKNESINPAKQIVVKLLGEMGHSISETTTNDQGVYRFVDVPKNTKVKVQIYSIMQRKQSLNSWNVQVVDNTQQNALYSIEGELVSSKDSDNIRNLKIPLASKASAPFSILNDIYTSMKKIINMRNVSFPPLFIKWSVNNNSSQGKFEKGQIGTSFFDKKESIYLLGDSHSDSDEFDSSVIIHEWSHYFEKNFSRTDNIGGDHGEGERLDIRVAFSEGFGNAWSAMVTDNPIYADTSGDRGWFMDIEQDKSIDAGWWSEVSVQKIIYDLYDENNESHDILSLGLEPLYDVLTTTQKETKAFTSLFSFITLLKQKVPLYGSQIDKLLLDENIESIEDDIYGEEHHNLYADLGEEICTSSQYGKGNKLLNHKYLRFTIDIQKSYTVRVKQTEGKSADPDFSLYSINPFRLKKEVSGVQKGIESSDFFLSTGDYLLDISDYNNISEVCFNISIK
jgi:hypothetical protein